MRIKGIGIDIVEFSQMQAHHSENFVRRILSAAEQSVYDIMTTEKRKLEYLAGRFAAKEAYTKAYGHFERPLNFNEVSVLPDDDGKPVIHSPYRPEDICHLSISHSPHYVVAVCQVIQTERD